MDSGKFPLNHLRINNSEQSDFSPAIMAARPRVRKISVHTSQPGYIQNPETSGREVTMASALLREILQVSDHSTFPFKHKNFLKMQGVTRGFKINHMLLGLTMSSTADVAKAFPTCPSRYWLLTNETSIWMLKDTKHYLVQ